MSIYSSRFPLHKTDKRQSGNLDTVPGNNDREPEFVWSFPRRQPNPLRGNLQGTSDDIRCENIPIKIFDFSKCQRSHPSLLNLCVRRILPASHAIHELFVSWPRSTFCFCCGTFRPTFIALEYPYLAPDIFGAQSSARHGLHLPSGLSDGPCRHFSFFSRSGPYGFAEFAGSSI